GLSLDWHKFYDGERPAFVSLPTYPFARDRYWFQRAASAARPRAGAAAPWHPLVQVNVSDFFEQRYQSVFSGNEFFLADHQVALGEGRQKILPAVAYLEMVRAAVDHALRGSIDAQQVQLSDVVWAEPVLVDGPTRVTIELVAIDDGGVRFAVNTGADNSEMHQHCSGYARLAPAASGDAIDLPAISNGLESVAPAALYAAFDALGVHYGPAFRCIQSLRRGADQVVAELVASDRNREDAGYVLPLGLLDSALQACLGLVEDPASRGG